MRRFLLAMIAACTVHGVAPTRAEKTRCGWFENPTPGDWWLADRKGGWLRGEQGGYEALGLDTLAEMTTAGWVATNGPHG